MPISMENLHRWQPVRSSICLFGRPDPLESDKLMTENFEKDRKRALERWGFDILSEEFINASPEKKSKVERKNSKKYLSLCEEDKENVNASVLERNIRSCSIEKKEDDAKAGNKDVTKNRKKTLKITQEKSYTKNSRQSNVLTDYWRNRKFSESSCSDKEN